ncbi:MAG: S1 RNA-binding domain-containing protein, partial [Clostridia bacterium]|nr:S1 RNA-binding domain-containing protein [Clostridia bacterium]
DGNVFVACQDLEAAQRAIFMVETIANDPEIGAIYKGVVTRLMSFGAFVEIAPGKEGMVHISRLDVRHVDRVEDVVTVGDEIIVKVIEIDDQNRINLSRRDALIEVEGAVPENDLEEEEQRRPRRSGGNYRRGGNDRRRRN